MTKKKIKTNIASNDGVKTEKKKRMKRKNIRKLNSKQKQINT